MNILALWVLQALLAIIFAMAGFAKVGGRLRSEHIQLESAGVIETPEVTHLRFRVVE